MIKNLLIIIFTVILLPSFGIAQLSKEQLQKIDSLVSIWNIPNSPGGIVGIIKNGEVLYVKSFGLASLEYDIPISENTVFNIGSVSKQITALGIIKLQLDGKLSIDDDIRKYIPELPDFGHKLTIRNLLHHTSGLRDIHGLLSLAGWRINDPKSNDDLFRLLKKQQELNFNPGDDFLYSNTNYILMGRIIEVVTGEKLIDWMKKNVFIPLEMPNTYIGDMATQVVKGNATSYLKLNDNNYTRAIEYWNYTGSGNVYTNIGEILKWLNNFTNPKNEWKSAFEMLQTTDKLNNGKTNKYAFGVEIDTINGIKRISHGGGVGGFRSFVYAFPKEHLSIAVLTNYSSSEPIQKINILAEIAFPELVIKTNTNEKSYNVLSTVSNDNLKKYEGDYWADDDNVARKIYLRNDTLWYFRNKGNESPMRYIGNEEFIIMPKAKFKTKFLFNKDSDISMQVESKESKSNFKLFKPADITSEYLSEFAGKYYSPELDTYYSFNFQNGKLIGYHPRHGNIKIEPLMKQDLFQGQEPLSLIIGVRDVNKKLKGIRVSYDRVNNLWLEKIK